MNESFLHYVWEKTHYQVARLATRDGKEVQVIKTGKLNQDQGPDFLEGHVVIGGLEMVGHIEIHISSEDWYRHKHERDPNYNSVVLHVVYESSGIPIRREDGTVVPEISLQGKLNPEVLVRHEQLRHSGYNIPCGPQLAGIDDFHVGAWLNRMGVLRIEEKVHEAALRLKDTVHAWEQVLWEELAAFLGGPANREAFRELAREVPIRTLKSYAGWPNKLEAILFGASGLLKSDQSKDLYGSYLSAEWGFLSMKHDLGIIRVPMRFLRMRPASFPTIRISQLASLVHTFPELMNLLARGGPNLFLETQIRSSIYWDTHYLFGEKTKPAVKRVGRAVRQTILANTLIPFGICYFRYHGRQDAAAWGVDELEKLPPENNRITRMYKEWKMEAMNALQSQGLVHLKKRYCDPKNCLNCDLGLRILKAEKKEWDIIRS